MVAPIGVLTVTLECDRMRSNGSSRVRLGPICETEQVREVLGGVGEVMLTGSKHGQLNGTALGTDRDRGHNLGMAAS